MHFFGALRFFHHPQVPHIFVQRIDGLVEAFFDLLLASLKHAANSQSLYPITVAPHSVNPALNGALAAQGLGVTTALRGVLMLKLRLLTLY